jgi:hypothetical protein
VLADGAVVAAWTEVTSAGADGVVSFTRHYRFSNGNHLTSSAEMRFRTEEDLRDALWRAGFRVDRVYGGWGREPVGLSEDGELIVIAVAESR